MLRQVLTDSLKSLKRALGLCNRPTSLRMAPVRNTKYLGRRSESGMALHDGEGAARVITSSNKWCWWVGNKELRAIQDAVVPQICATNG
jgi:hypothetical protein